MTSVQKRADDDQRSMPLRQLTATTAVPVATVAANLMPPEVVAKRRLGWLKRRLAFALAALIALIALGYVLAQQETAGTEDDLAAAQSQTALLQRQTGSFAKIVQVQSDTAQLRARLAGAMTNDLPWSALLDELTRTAPRGVVITDVDGELTAATPGAQAAPQPGTYQATAAPAVGTLDVSGNAKDYGSIAAYVDTLSKSKLFASVEPGSLGSENGRATFTLSITITKAALGGRFGTAGGK